MSTAVAQSTLGYVKLDSHFEFELPQATDSPGSHVITSNTSARPAGKKELIIRTDFSHGRPSLPDGKLYSVVKGNGSKGMRENGPLVKTTMAGICEVNQGIEGCLLYQVREYEEYSKPRQGG